MPRALADKITIADADGGNARQYPLLSWEEEAVTADTMPPGEPVSKKFRFFGGGMGERQDMGRGGYFYSENAAHGDPFALKPRPEISTLTLTGNASPVERFFEADDGTNWYLYALAGAKSFKIKTITTTPTLAETKTFTAVGTFFAHGTYVGSGSGQSITGVGFQPAAVIVKGDLTEHGHIRTVDMDANDSKPFDNVAFVTDGITSLDADGFTVSTDDDVDKSGETYYWMAWKAEAGVVATGEYTGDGVDDRQITGAGFLPAVVMVFPDFAKACCIYQSTFGSNGSLPLGLGGIYNADGIQAVHGDGFEIGTNDFVNKSTEKYYWLAMRHSTGQLITGTYTGNGIDGRAITGVGFEPVYVILVGKNSSSLSHVHRCATITGDETQAFKNTANAANQIESLDADGFTVGGDDGVNKPEYTFHWIALGVGGGTPAIGKSAKWPNKWIVPGGDSADSQQLTTVHNEGGAGDDTWTPLYGLSARHFERRGNKLAKATKRHVSLCSADDVTDAANWGAEYGGVADVAIGAPDVEITDLVDWGQELAVCATDGMYMFDGVATSKQQLPLLGGLTDDDNGKGVLNWGSFMLYPSADGLWRWQYGAHKTVGPDAIPGYGSAPETSNEPINLKHYGLTFCGDHIYEAAYDGTNYLLIHYRPVEDGFIPDCLVSTTNAIKMPYVDRNRYLWFGYGNNLAYIKLSQGGEPDGGNFCNASLVTTIYLPEVLLADDADVSLRMVKAIVRNMDDGGADTYKWELHASLDGAAFGAQIGTDIQGAAMDGVNKRYWTAASNPTARRLRLKIVGTATAGYTPTTTAPEIIDLEVHGQTMPDDAEIVEAIINLDKSTRSPKTVYAELKARRNAGVVQVRHPVDNTVMDMIIYKCKLTQVKQKGYEEPIGVAVLYMRHGDTS